MYFIGGDWMGTTKETTETSTESELGKRKTTKKEITTEKDSKGNIVSKTTTTEETEKD
jgi:hypothetical protein